MSEETKKRPLWLALAHASGCWGRSRLGGRSQNGCGLCVELSTRNCCELNPLTPALSPTLEVNFVVQVDSEGRGSEKVESGEYFLRASRCAGILSGLALRSVARDESAVERMHLEVATRFGLIPFLIASGP